MLSHCVKQTCCGLAFALVALISTMSLVVLSQNPAAACGGFFCNQLPMEQTGENIIFSVTEERVTSIVQINYMGSADDFAWVVPVQSQPELGVAPLKAFETLRNATAPRFWLDWQDLDGECMYWGYSEASEDGGGPPNAGGGVELISQEEVGPYNASIVKSDDPQALLDWLNENEFDQPEESLPLIAHYVELEMLFVAIKLKKGAEVDEIQPLRMDFVAPEPCIPLVLTQIAASPDMPVLAYVLGEQRAVPTNWLHVEVNQKKINWMSNGSNYEEVLTQAIDEASGRAFTTEYAGSTDFMKDALYYEGQYDTEALKSITDPAEMVDELFWQGYPNDAQLKGLIRTQIPMPPLDTLPEDCQTEQEFYNWNKEKCMGFLEEPFDSIAFCDALEERIVIPLKEVQDMFNDQRYLTRLYSTISPEEMNRDPLFDFNPDLGDVDNNHTAQATGTCNDSGMVSDVTIILEDGSTFTLPGEWELYGWYGSEASSWPDIAPEEGAAADIRLMGSSGPGEVVSPAQVAEVDDRLQQEEPDMVANDLRTDNTDELATPKNADEGCSVPGDGTRGMLWLNLMVLLGWATRRRLCAE